MDPTNSSAFLARLLASAAVVLVVVVILALARWLG